MILARMRPADADIDSTHRGGVVFPGREAGGASRPARRGGTGEAQYFA
jgi:hypothetical protein